jgi:hypothetical protein
MTDSERARQRATTSRLRAYVKHNLNGTHFYVVHNLCNHHKYTIANYGGTWTCHCEGAKGKHRCQHLQRVLDREEQRIRQEALAEV